MSISFYPLFVLMNANNAVYYNPITNKKLLIYPLSQSEDKFDFSLFLDGWRIFSPAKSKKSLGSINFDLPIEPNSKSAQKLVTRRGSTDIQLQILNFDGIDISMRPI